MPTPTKGGYLFHFPICEFPYRLIISRSWDSDHVLFPKRFYPLRKGCRESIHPSLVIPDAGVSLNVSPLPAVGITDVRYLTSKFPRVADITGGVGRCTLKRGIL